MRIRLAVVPVVAALAILPALSACSPEPSDPVRAARTKPDAPGWVSDPTGVNCGTVELDGRTALPKKNLECLGDASHAGEDAFLTWTQRTTEGDTTPYFAKTTRSGVSVASTQVFDTYGRGGWTETTCADVADLPSCDD